MSNLYLFLILIMWGKMQNPPAQIHPSIPILPITGKF